LQKYRGIEEAETAMLWRVEETGAQEFFCKGIDIPWITLFADTDSAHRDQNLALIHPVENPISLPNGAEAPIA
jgi:hypothetical protein